MDIENVLCGYAKLYPSYRKEQDVNHNGKDIKKKTTNQKTPDQKKKKPESGGSEPSPSTSSENTSSRTERPEKVNYVPDMSEPRTFLNTLFQSVLKLRLPSDFGQEMRRLLKFDPSLSDVDVLKNLGFVDKGKVKTRYRVELTESAISIVYTTEEDKETRVSGPGLRFMIFTACNLILDDLCRQLRESDVWRSVAFAQLSKKLVWNPFFRVASLIPLTQPPRVSPVLGLLLMDNRLSLMTMSFMLRSASVSVTLKDKYDKIEYNQEESVIKDINRNKYGDINYSFLVANGTYEIIRVKWRDMLRDDTPRITRPRKAIQLSEKTCSW